MCLETGKDNDLFSNWCGKVLLYELLTLYRYQRDFSIKLSTTGNPYKDWCGFVGSKLKGIVDILAQSTHSIIIGEIKGLRSSFSEGIWQLVGAMLEPCTRPLRRLASGQLVSYSMFFWMVYATRAIKNISPCSSLPNAYLGSELT